MSQELSQFAPQPQLDLFGIAGTPQRFAVESAPEIDVALAKGSPIFCGVSGGKDSQALAYRVDEHLDAIGHTGPRFLIHSDLGRVEWKQSLPVCERLAQRLGLELIVVRRQAGDMMDRWLSRWSANVARYANLECVKLILPWSTPSQRFCTSELKGAPIGSAMRKRFPTGDVVSAVGIRREESSSRARMPVWKRDERTMRKSGVGHAWNPLMGWTRGDVLDYIRSRGDMLHEAYTIYSASRVSCAFHQHEFGARPDCLGELRGQPGHLPRDVRPRNHIDFLVPGKPVAGRRGTASPRST